MVGRRGREIPAGWYLAALSAELGASEVLPLQRWGRAMVLYRSEAGRAQLLAAHCPHLGAHLGHGGKVCGGRLICPFHGWEFEVDGRCARVPYADRIPPRATLRSWPVVERDGLLMAWYDPAGGPPAWEVPPLEELGAPGWTAPRWVEWRLRATVEEMGENQVDAAHFVHVHGAAQIPEIRAEPRGHVLLARSRSVRETPFGRMTGEVEIESHGLGYSLLRFRGLFESLIVGCAIPLDEETVLLRTGVMVRERVPGAGEPLVEAIVQGLHVQVEQDRPIWEHMIRVERPLLVDGDGPIGVFRAWARQFHTARAPSAEGGGAPREAGPPD